MRTRHPHRLRRVAAVATLALASTSAVVAAAGPADAAGSNKVTVTAGEYLFKTSGKPKPGNVEIVFDNPGVEIHMMVIVPLKKGVTVKQLTQAVMSEDEEEAGKVIAGDEFGVPGTPGLLSPGEATTNITSLKAGRYGLLCFVPDPEGHPHVAEGMVAVFDVKGGKSNLTPPTDGVTEVSVDDTAITIPSSGLPKSGWVKVTNDGSTGRDLTIAKYESATTFEEADAAFDSFFMSGQFPGGSEPASLRGGVLMLAPGGSAYVKVSLESGKWVLVSADDEGENDVHLDFDVS